MESLLVEVKFISGWVNLNEKHKLRLIFGGSFPQGDTIHLRNEILMREQSWLSGELLQQAEFAGAGLVVVQLHLIG